MGLKCKEWYRSGLKKGRCKRFKGKRRRFARGSKACPPRPRKLKKKSSKKCQWFGRIKLKTGGSKWACACRSRSPAKCSPKSTAWMGTPVDRATYMAAKKAAKAARKAAKKAAATKAPYRGYGIPSSAPSSASAPSSGPINFRYMRAAARRTWRDPQIRI